VILFWGNYDETLFLDKFGLFFLAWIVRTKIKCLSKLPLLRFHGVVSSLRFLNLTSITTILSVIAGHIERARTLGFGFLLRNPFFSRYFSFGPKNASIYAVYALHDILKRPEP